MRGPERVAITGPNGAGKTTLLRTLAGASLDGTLDATARSGAAPDETATEGTALADGTFAAVMVRRNAASGYLPQRLDILDDELTVVDNVRAVAPRASVNDVRAGLARFLFRGARADQVAGSLSGGERFRAVLAALLLADPPPQLLLLDEPTNNLDLASVRQLSQALSCYRGALVVVSHDVPFLHSIGVTRWLHLDRTGRLAETEPPRVSLGLACSRLVSRAVLPIPGYIAGMTGMGVPPRGERPELADADGSRASCCTRRWARRATEDQPLRAVLARAPRARRGHAADRFRLLPA